MYRRFIDVKNYVIFDVINVDMFYSDLKIMGCEQCLESIKDYRNKRGSFPIYQKLILVETV